MGVILTGLAASDSAPQRRRADRLMFVFEAHRDVDDEPAPGLVKWVIDDYAGNR
jgi:hypothetical protein